MGSRDYLKLGDYNVICDVCRFKYKASECKLRWDNLFVCPHCYEERQPQDFVKGVKDDPRVPIARPDPEPRFVTGEVDPDSL